MVLQVYVFVIFRVQQFQFGTEVFQTFRFVFVQHKPAGFGIYGRNVVNAFAYGIYVHHGAAGQEYDLVLGIELLKKLQYFGFILGGTCNSRSVAVCYKVMPYPLQLFRGRGGRTDFQIGIKLS